MSSGKIYGGSRNEQGFINNLFRRGMTLNRGMSELLANPSDAFSKNAVIKISKDFIDFIDYGNGMKDKDSVWCMYDTERENNKNNKSMGVSGWGGPPSQLCLSKDAEMKPRPTYVITKHVDGPYLYAKAPWDKIIENKKYDRMIEIDDATPEMIREFNEDRERYCNL